MLRRQRDDPRARQAVAYVVLKSPAFPAAGVSGAGAGSTARRGGTCAPGRNLFPKVLVPASMGRATDMVLYQAEWCPYCARVRKKMTDLLLDYKTVNVPHSHAERDEVKAVSNQTSIPVLVDGDVVLDDDDDIIPYLEKKYGAAAAT
jgi:glutaredoxin